MQPCDEDEGKDDQFFIFPSNGAPVECKGKPRYSGKTCPSATLSTTNSTWTNPGFRGYPTFLWSHHAGCPPVLCFSTHNFRVVGKPCFDVDDSNKEIICIYSDQRLIQFNTLQLTNSAVCHDYCAARLATAKMAV